jgi:hypothetical protein
MQLLAKSAWNLAFNKPVSLSTLFRNVPSLVDWFYALVLILILGSI